MTDPTGPESGSRSPSPARGGAEPAVASPERVQADVEELRLRVTETRTLYREVCALLFFRYGITPTANRLYQLVRRGSMGVPGEELARFWSDLRARSRVEVAHPGLPDALRASAGELLSTLWQHARSEAETHWNAAREEAQARVAQAAALQDAAEKRARDLEADLLRMHTDLGSARAEASRLQAAVDQGAATLAQTVAQVQAVQQQVGGLQEQLQIREKAWTQERQEWSRTQAEERRAWQERAKADLDAALARAEAAERRWLLELDQERQQRKGVERTLAAQERELSAARTGLHQATQAVQERDGMLQRLEVERIRMEREHTVAASREATLVQALSAAESGRDDLARVLAAWQRSGPAATGRRIGSRRPLNVVGGVRVGGRRATPAEGTEAEVRRNVPAPSVRRTGPERKN